MRVWATYLPDTEELDEEVLGESTEQDLGDHEHVGAQSGFQHDGHVGGVEQLDGVDTTLATVAVRLDGDLNTEALEVNDDREDDDGGDEGHDIREAITVEGFLEGPGLVVPSEEEMEQGDQGTLELGSTAGVDGRGGEGLPDDGFADVGGDEEGDAGTEAVPLLEEFVEEDDDEGGDDELEDQEETDTGTEVGGLAVETCEDVDGSLAERDEERKDCKRGVSMGSRGRRGRLTFLSTTEESPVLLETEIDLDEIGAGEELHDHAGSDDGGDAEFHEGSSVGGEDDPHPVQRIRGVGGHDPVQRHLGAHEEDEERDRRPCHFLVERHLRDNTLDSAFDCQNISNLPFVPGMKPLGGWGGKVGRG